MRAKEFIRESREDFEGITIEMKKRGHVLDVSALDDWGNNILGYVIFNIGDNNELDPQELEVDHRYQGQGIARVMYDYVKNKGYKIVRSYDQTDAGKGFWDKHRGEEVRVWESSNQSVAERKKGRKKKSRRHGGYFFPGYGFYGGGSDSSEGGGDGGGESMAEGLTPTNIHRLADRKGVKWDNEPNFLQLTKRLTGKEHLDDLDQAGLQKVKRYLEKQDKQ